MTVSLAAIVTIKSLSIWQRLGLHSGTAENIFVIVLIYGAGVDYGVLLTGRFREVLSLHAADTRLANAKAAVVGSFAASAGAIVTAALTNILGMFTLTSARYEVFRTTGAAVGIALTIALIACMTLLPALMAIFGGWMFWPRHKIAQVRRADCGNSWRGW